MLQSVYDLNPTRLNRMTSTLQRLQDEPNVLDRSRRRFDADDPPPPYSPATITDPPTPTFFAQRSEHEINELVRRPLDNNELYWFRTSFHAYHAGARFEEEARKEEQRIRGEYSKRDEYYRPLYHGPDLIGRPGLQRLKIMVRNGVRKRWERLGVWNSAWGIPGRVNDGACDNTNEWRWEWEKLRQFHVAWTMEEFEEEKAQWPTRDEEGPDARAIRQLLEDKGQWGERYGPAMAGGNQDTEVDVDHHESIITSRPWFRWKLEVQEEARRLARARRFTIPDCETAEENARARWQAQGDWKDTWSDSPGWRWRHESPSPEPEDPNDMNFSPSEIDALDTIPPRTPPSTIPIESGPINYIPDLFSKTGPMIALQPVASATQHKVENHGAAGERRQSRGPKTQQSGHYSPDASAENQPERDFVGRQRQKQHLPHNQDQLDHSSTALPTARTLGKRKRNGEGETCNIETSSTGMTPATAPRQAKRPCITPFPQVNLSLGLNSISTRKLTSEERIRRNPDQHIADTVGALQAAEACPGPRRSSRIRARQGTSQSAEYDEQVELRSVNDDSAHKKLSRSRKRVETKALTNRLVPQSIIKTRTGRQSGLSSPRRKR